VVRASRIPLESGSVGVQLGGEEIDLVILSLDRDRRLKLLSDRFAIGSDASAVWGNGKSAHGDTNTKFLFFGHTKGTFAGFAVDGATLKSDQSSDKALYGKKLTKHAIVEGGCSRLQLRSHSSKLSRKRPNDLTNYAGF